MSLVNVLIVLGAVVGVAFIVLQERPYFVAVVSLCVGAAVHAFYILAPIQTGACSIGAHELVAYLHQLDVCMETTLERSLTLTSRNSRLMLWGAQVMILAGVAALPVIYAGNMVKRD